MRPEWLELFARLQRPCDLDCSWELMKLLGDVAAPSPLGKRGTRRRNLPVLDKQVRSSLITTNCRFEVFVRLSRAEFRVISHEEIESAFAVL